MIVFLLCACFALAWLSPSRDVLFNVATAAVSVLAAFGGATILYQVFGK